MREWDTYFKNLLGGVETRVGFGIHRRKREERMRKLN